MDRRGILAERLAIANARVGTYLPVAWSTDQLSGPEVVEPDSEGDVFTVSFGTPTGKVTIMAEVEIVDLADGRRRIILRGAHIHSDGGPRSIGVVNLRMLAGLLLERIDYDEALVEGGTRTTGANPGHRPRPLRFTRNREDPPGG